jgi:hypothetical protein
MKYVSLVLPIVFLVLVIWLTVSVQKRYKAIEDDQSGQKIFLKNQLGLLFLMGLVLLGIIGTMVWNFWQPISERIQEESSRETVRQCVNPPVPFEINQQGTQVEYSFTVPAGWSWQFDFGDGRTTEILYNTKAIPLTVEHNYKTGEFSPKIYVYDYENNCSSGTARNQPVVVK